MGWWGTDIMEGDTPLDLLGEFEDIVFGNLSEDEIDRLTDDQVLEMYKQQYPKLVWVIRQQKMDSTLWWANEEELLIATQVLGEFIVTNGFFMNEQDKDWFIQAGLDDPWAKENSERKTKMDAYVERIRSYVVGTPIDTTSRGLFESMSEIT